MDAMNHIIATPEMDFTLLLMQQCGNKDHYDEITPEVLVNCVSIVTLPHCTEPLPHFRLTAERLLEDAYGAVCRSTTKQRNIALSAVLEALVNAMIECFFTTKMWGRTSYLR